MPMVSYTINVLLLFPVANLIVVICAATLACSLTHSLSFSLWCRYAMVVVLFACLISTAHSYGPDSSLSTDAPTVSSPSNTTFTCSDLPTSRQRELCHSTRGLLKVLISAEQDARDKCAIHFRHHKWNCYDFNMLSPSNITMTSM